MITIHVEKCIIPTSRAILRKFNLQTGGRVQQAIDKAVIDYNLQYVPWETGTLGKSAYGATRIGSGMVVYPGPYAHYMYYGEVYGPNIPVFEDDSGVPTCWFSPPGKKKHPTGRSLKYATDVNPLAGPFWNRRMKAAHMKDIVREAKNAAGIK